MGPIKPGDRFLLVTARWNVSVEPLKQWITVTKVGRKWADYQVDSRGHGAKYDRFDMETMVSDGGQFVSNSKVYRSEQDYLDVQRADKIWSEFRDRVGYTRPAKLRSVDILKAADALGFRLKEE